MKDSQESLTNKYKNAINGLKSRLAECRSEANIYKITSTILMLSVIIVSIYAWRLVSTKERFNPRKSADEDVYRAKYRWRAINHKHNIFNERIFDNDFTRAAIVNAIKRRREERARLDNAIKATIDTIRLVKQRINQVINAINRRYELFISRIRKFTNATCELTKRIKDSDVFSREIQNTTREFEEVARRYVLSRIPEDTKIDVSKIRRKEIGDIGVGSDMGMG